MRIRPVRWLVVLVAAVAAGGSVCGAEVHVVPQAASARDARPPTSAVLLGQVVDAETGDPVPDAIVTLTGRPAPPRGRGAAAPASSNFFDLIAAAGNRGGQERVAADGTGRFVFRDLPASRYTARAEAPGYLAAFAGPTGLGGGPATVEVADGQVTARASIRLWKAATLTGVVLDEANEPVIQARVAAYRRTISRVGRVTYGSSGSGATDDRGQYRISNLPPGDYLVVVPQSHSTSAAAGADALLQGLMSGQMPADLAALGRGGSPMDPRAVRVGEWRVTSSNVQAPSAAGEGPLPAYRTIYYAGATTPAAAESVILRAGEERAGVDFVLQPVMTGRISGTVMGPSGPAGGVPVRVVSAGPQPVGAASLPEVAEGRTGGDGRFTLLAVPPGDYRVIAERAPPNLPPDLPEELASNPMMKMVLDMQRGAGRTPLYGESIISLGPGDAADIAITASEGVELTGRLEFDGPAPAPADVARNSIVLRALDGEAGARTVRPNPEGTFSLPGVRPGRYGVSSVMTATASGSWLVREVTAAGRSVTTTPLVVGDKPLDLVVTLTNRIGSIQGTVRRDAAAGGTPVGGTAAAPVPLTALVVPANYVEWTDLELAIERVRIVRVGDDGTFRPGPMLAGEYLVAVVDEGRVDLSREIAALQAIASQATRVTVATGEPTPVTVGVAVRR